MRIEQFPDQGVCRRSSRRVAPSAVVVASVLLSAAAVPAKTLFLCGTAALPICATSLPLYCSAALPFPSGPVPGELPALGTDEKAAGFELLFNGTDLTGWEEVQGKPGTFAVHEGVLAGVKKQETAYWLSTRDQYGDFELRLEYRVRPGGNSGVFIRAPREGRTSQKGMEIQIYDEGPDKRTPGVQSTGSIYGVVPPRKLVARPPGEWNELWILCDGDRVRITLNGEVVNDARMSDFDALKDRPRRGYIGLSAHTERVEFRQVRLRKIISRG